MHEVEIEEPLKEIKDRISTLESQKKDSLQKIKSLQSDYDQTIEVISIIEVLNARIIKISKLIKRSKKIENSLLLIKKEVLASARKTKHMFFRERFITAEITLEYFLAKELGIYCKTLEQDTKLFSTPYGKRRLDCYHSNLKIALESKLGYCCLSKRIRDEINKDIYLLAEGLISRCVWVLFSGGSKPLINKLKTTKIVVYVGWDNFKLSEYIQLDYLPDEYFI
jgi:hypothetical protein